MYNVYIILVKPKRCIGDVKICNARFRRLQKKFVYYGFIAQKMYGLTQKKSCLYQSKTIKTNTDSRFQ
ncbi:hypothetical protein HanRHA438_Chr16g0746631 [Helianthus annuus]|uniref:Uncharacterized protein n=1 Tax=Helianthus annuus TaxID=4232 RepID=A0A9K3DPB0_HELAN|nr:hypothetical protein HanXRQr2_Chr16g0734151 [Helianthus annuus]KAJ0820135.1 hypothetical protein HanPSC8_Chr16g0704251 [Helianthus annuus]KAJ0834703.1 hypothetical protein HanRHA438_Chr16g0746631 [Helianthus annuus]